MAVVTFVKGGELVCSLRSRVVAVVVLLVVASSLACSDKNRRMSEAEAIRYKMALIQEQRGEISPGHAEELMYHSARTRASIDRAYDDYREQHSEEQAVERARFDLDRSQLDRDGSEETGIGPGETMEIIENQSP